MITNYNPQQLEPEILEFWKNTKAYEEAKEKNKGKESFYFLDGPPYTSGRVHIGTAWNKSLKDMVLRYKRMKGFDVWDRAGYDMHGLPVEHKVQEKFDIKHKDDIPKFGVQRFVEECKSLAMENMKLMNQDFIRMGVWMDFENAYYPLRTSFIEGEWWLIKKAHENGRLYEGMKTMSWCANCSTALAKHELEYNEISDDSIFLKFKVAGKDNEYLIIWTTTPWTICFNIAIMVNPELDYLRAKVGDETWILSKALAGVVVQNIANQPKLEIIEEFTGDKLEGMKYEHPWYEELKPMHEIKAEKVFTVLMSKEYVDTTAGTGLVHCAPGCGPEDYEIGHRNGLPAYNNIDENGVFPQDMGRFAGLVAKKDDKKFIEEMRKDGFLIETTVVEHEYAHCWRCHKPIVFRTTRQWFFKVEDMKERMRELNSKIQWVPDWGGSRQFDSWLDNLRDNAITRQRVWGTPVPIWKCSSCEKYEVIGSVKELMEKCGDLPEDLHKPWIDELKMKCSCGAEMSRVPDILDVWIDAGTTSWTCLDYPQNTELFKRLFPADFILEGKDQIRGWFNLLFVASMVAMDECSYKAVYMHGFVQDAEGRKMSKSLGNVISPYEVIDQFGADTLRYYMISCSKPGVDINYNFDDMKVKHKNLMILWNLHKYIISLAKELDFNPFMSFMDDYSAEERYIMSRLHSTIAKVTEKLDGYFVDEAPMMIEQLFLDLSRTYIQLVRDKAAVGSENERKIVAVVIANVLLNTLKMFAPVAPFITEAIYQNFAKEFGLKPASIHLHAWPKSDVKLIDEKLEKNMDIASSVIQAALSSREKVQMGARWPLKEVVIITGNKDTVDAIIEMEDVIKSQVNVKEVNVKTALPGSKTRVRAEYNKLGPDFGELSPAIVAQIAMNSPESILNHIEKENKYVLSINGKEVALTKEHLVVEREIPKNYIESQFRNGCVYINTERTPELEGEGFAREMMRRAQQLRKKAGLEKQDRIYLSVICDDDLKEMIEPHAAAIKEKVGALKVEIGSGVREFENSALEKVKGKEFTITLEKVA